MRLIFPTLNLPPKEIDCTSDVSYLLLESHGGTEPSNWMDWVVPQQTCQTDWSTADHPPLIGPPLCTLECLQRRPCAVMPAKILESFMPDPLILQPAPAAGLEWDGDYVGKTCPWETVGYLLTTCEWALRKEPMVAQRISRSFLMNKLGLCNELHLWSWSNG